MKRGTRQERVLAILGIGSWVLVVVLSALPPADPFGIGICVAATAISVWEVIKWQRSERYKTGRNKDESIYPRTAWFGVGAVLASFGLGIVLGIAGTESIGRFDVRSIIAWLVGGFGAQWFLVRQAKHHENAAKASSPPLPPAPPDRAPTVEPRSRSDIKTSRLNSGPEDQHRL